MTSSYIINLRAVLCSDVTICAAVYRGVNVIVCNYVHICKHKSCQQIYCAIMCNSNHMPYYLRNDGISNICVQYCVVMCNGNKCAMYNSVQLCVA